MQISMKKILYISKIVSLLAVLATISGCIKTVKMLGYTPESDKFDQLVPGKTRKAVVKRELGSPSSISTYGKDTWYYISTEQESVAFLSPKIKSQKVVAIEFNEDQTIRLISKYDEADARDVKLSNDTTKTEGHDAGALGQLLGNVGRYNSDRRDVASPR
jgi:outer membrane protein assembly factor BamE (lipoprotein component of BamABCDE complex)